MSENKSLTIAIVTWNSENEIADCLNSLESAPANWEIWVADNLSADKTVNIVREKFPRVKIIENKENLGFAAGNNQIFKQTESDFVLLLNPDTIVSVEAVEAALEEIEKRPKVGVLGIQALGEDAKIQETCFSFPAFLPNLVNSVGLYRFFSDEWKEKNLSNEFFNHRSERSSDWIMGAFMLVRREVIEKVGGLPEDYFMFTEEMDWCYRIRRAGFEILFTPKVSFVHKLNKSAGQKASDWRIEKTVLGKYFFCRTHYGNFRTKLIQLTDFFGLTLNIWRFSQSRTAENLERKTYRKIVWKSLFLSKPRLREVLQKR